MTTLAVKTPVEDKKYVFDVSAWMTDLGTEISSVDSITADAGVTASLQGNTTSAIEVLVSGGTAGNVYKIRAQFQTGDGQILTADMRVPVDEEKE